MTNLVCRWTLSVGLLVLALGLGGCSVDLTPCESDLDCTILCECPDRDGTITVGPFTCRAGNCGARHAEERSCERTCDTPPGYVPPATDDDDSAGADDDDSAR